MSKPTSKLKPTVSDLKSGIPEADDKLIEEIDDEFREAQKLSQGSSIIRRRLAEEINSDVEPEIAGDDPDANWMEASTSGDESVVGGNPSPDQTDVDVIGSAMGIEYQDNEPLHTPEKVRERDKRRWELDPASSEDYKERLKDFEK